MTQTNDKADFRSSLKSLDTEETIDIYFYRRLGWMWALIARRLGITPNAISIASIFIGIAAGICFYPTNILVNIGGLLLLILANSFDSADGQLARLTGQYSQLGRILDGLAGDIWFLTIYIVICLRTVHTIAWFEDHRWAIWTIAATAGACHIFQAAMADYYRQMHLQCVNGKSELVSSDNIRREYQASRGLKRIIMRLYLIYTRCQEHFTPKAIAYRRMTAESYPDKLRAKFRQGSLPLMKYTNILTFNWRSIAIAVTLLGGAPWVYFAIEIVVFNALLIYMMWRHERLCASLVKC